MLFFVQKVENSMAETLYLLLSVSISDMGSSHSSAKRAGSSLHEGLVPQFAVDEALQQLCATLHEQPLHPVCMEVLHHLRKDVAPEVHPDLYNHLCVAKIPKNIGEKDCFCRFVKQMQASVQDASAVDGQP